MPIRFFPRSDRFRCPGEEQLAAYVDQQLIGAERERVETHLANCDSCLKQVGFLVQHAQAAPVEPPAWLVARAERLTAQPRDRAPNAWKWAAAAATIAVVAVTAVELPRLRSAESAPSSAAGTQQAAQVHAPAAPSEAPESAVRSRSTADSLPVLLSPLPGTSVPEHELTVRWEPVANAIAYDVKVVTADGDLVWQDHVKNASASARSAKLNRGQKYFVWVSAVLPDGKTQQSKPVEFIGG